MNQPTNQIRILVIQANPPGTAPLDSDLEQRKLAAALLAALDRARFAPAITLPAARIEDLPRTLHYHQPHILHFIGHGDGAGELLLNASDDRGQAVLAATNLADLIAIYQAEATTPLQIILLAGCDTAPAAQLLRAHVPCVIGTTDDILDAAVRDVLTPAFYAALGDGRSVGNALAAARAELRSQGYAEDAEMVQIYTRGNVDPATLRPQAWLTARSPLPLAYLQSLFDQPWATVSLADIQRDRRDQAQLLDLYVPLPVDFTIVVKTERGAIVDWWAKVNEIHDDRRLAYAESSIDGEADAEELLAQREQVRQWANLRVEEPGLAQIVAGIQQKIAV
ncbi:MAG: CHAT domain-containing protein, partial [Caldilineaceae bacterium]|nr:CHAT domain-containing protein [Caldilineaceae bacterium]